MNRYLFVLAIANLDGLDEPSPANIQFLHAFVEAENEEVAYTRGQSALANALQDATEPMTKEGISWVANDYVVQVGTLFEDAPQLRLTMEK